MNTISLEIRSGRDRAVIETMEALSTTSPSRVLSAMGHPGYSDEWASRLLLDWIEQGGEIHRLVYDTPQTQARASLSVWKREVAPRIERGEGK